MTNVYDCRGGRAVRVSQPNLFIHEKIIAGDDIGATRIEMLFTYYPGVKVVPLYVGLPMVIKEDEDDENVAATSIDTITLVGYFVNLNGPAIEGQIIRNIYLKA